MRSQTSSPSRQRAKRTASQPATRRQSASAQRPRRRWWADQRPCTGFGDLAGGRRTKGLSSAIVPPYPIGSATPHASGRDPARTARTHRLAGARNLAAGTAVAAVVVQLAVAQVTLALAIVFRCHRRAEPLASGLDARPRSRRSRLVVGYRYRQGVGRVSRRGLPPGRLPDRARPDGQAPAAVLALSPLAGSAGCPRRCRSR